MGAFYTIASLPVDDADRFCAWCLEHFSYRGRTIFLAPASGFYASPGLGKDQVRLAYVLQPDLLSPALDILKLALKTYNS
jgi:aspartate aminotransferase